MYRETYIFFLTYLLYCSLLFSLLLPSFSLCLCHGEADAFSHKDGGRMDFRIKAAVEQKLLLVYTVLRYLGV